METQIIDLQYVLVGGILGMLGQGIRVLIGLKKLNDKNQEEEFNSGRMRLTIFIGFVTGGVAAVTMQKPVSKEVALSLIAIGYLGVDFLEGLFLQHIMPVVAKTTLQGVAQASVQQSSVAQIADQGGVTTVAQQSTTSTSVSNLPASTPNIAPTNGPPAELLPPVNGMNTASAITNVSSINAGLWSSGNMLSVDLSFILSASIGENMPNRPGDVRTLKQKFHELGYTWTPLNDQVDKELFAIINLFQSIIRGDDKISGDSVISVPGFKNSAYGWLQADNAPRWTKLGPGSVDDRTVGYVNDTINDNPADYYGTDWLVRIIEEAGLIYYRNHLMSFPKASIIYVNDLSEAKGEPSAATKKEHKGHRTGLLVDIRLPRTDGKSGGITTGSSTYDRDAARQIIKAFRQTSIGVLNVLLNDTVLRDEGLCRLADSSHDNHMHIHIKVPPKLIAVLD